MPALVAGIHDFFSWGAPGSKTWMAGTSLDKPGHDGGAYGRAVRRFSHSSTAGSCCAEKSASVMILS
jgi:hypothetical protein